VRFLENIVESALGTARFMAGLWFVGIMLFGLLATGLTYGVSSWGNSQEAMEARAETQRLRIEADERKAELANQRALSDDGWGSDAAGEMRFSPDTARRSAARGREIREAREMREAGWGN